MIEDQSRRVPLTLIATIALIGITAVWGLTFVTVKEALERIPPFQFLAIRWILAALILAITFPRNLFKLSAPIIRGGALAGIALAVGYGLQTVGLIYLSATSAGFLTGLFVVFTPPLSALLLRRWPRGRVLFGVVVATAGLFLLTGGSELSLDFGELLLLGTALSFAFHMVLLGKYSPRFDAPRLTFVQIAFSAVAFTLATALWETPTFSIDAAVWQALLLTGVVASAAGFLIQTWAQKFLSPVRTSITLTMEPVFAGIFGFLLLGERLSALGWIGAGLILAAMLLSDSAPRDARPFRD